MPPRKRVSPPRAGESNKRQRRSTPTTFTDYTPIHVNFLGLSRSQRLRVNTYFGTVTEYENVLRSYRSARSSTAPGRYIAGGMSHQSKEALARRLEHLLQKLQDEEDALIEVVDRTPPGDGSNNQPPPPSSGATGGATIIPSWV